MINEHKKGVKAVKYTKKSKGVEPAKPRNFVAKNAINTGAGAHTDKKKAAKQGVVKHKKKEYAESLQGMLEQALNEEGLSPMKRLQIIRFIAKAKGWGISDLELATDPELIDMYKKIKAGEEVAEAANPAQQAAVAIAKKKKKVKEGWTHDSLAAELFETPSYEGRLQEMLEGAVAFMEGGTEDSVTMFSKEPGHHRKEAGYDKGEYDEEGGMIKNDLQTIVRVASRLEKVIDADENLPTWVIEKIAQSKGMIVSVVDYIISQHEMGVKPQQK